jgi:flagellar basal-body rod protein FlgF
MERGLYIAAAGMVAEMVRQDQISNDLANAATPGYKADRAQQQSFADLLLQNQRTGETVGKLGMGPIITKHVTDFSPEPVRDTDEPLDLAVVGDGYFAIKTEAGVRFSRNGAFQAAQDGTLTDQLGNPVLGPDKQPLKVNADGTVDAAKVGIFALKDPAKQGDSLFTGTPTGAADGEVRTGALEASGVNAGRTMVDMMASMRAFEATQKAITTIDSTLQQASGQLGQLPG